MFSPVLCAVLFTVMNPGCDIRCRISSSVDVVTNSIRSTVVRNLVVRAALEFGGGGCNLHKSFAQKICYQCVQASLVIRDLTLRVFAITRFREKSCEKIVQ